MIKPVSVCDILCIIRNSVCSFVIDQVLRKKRIRMWRL